jgi:Zn-dependent protease
MDIAHLIQTVSLYAIPVIFSITLHEAAHGYAARYFGDTTAWTLGRVSLNPMKHIDPVGTILLPLLLYFSTSGAFLFGYAKPVPVNFARLRHPKRDMVWVALAGPAINFAQAIVWGAALFVFQAAAVSVFNLFPLPPLDGGRILVGLLPMRQAYWLSRVEPWGFFIVMALVLTKVINTFWMQPLMELSFEALDLLLGPLRMVLQSGSAAL